MIPYIEYYADHLPERRLGVFGIGLILCGFALQSFQYWLGLLMYIQPEGAEPGNVAANRGDGSICPPYQTRVLDSRSFRFQPRLFLEF